ncbi:MAG: ABC transporter permease [Lachnospiraceae bacterium]|nr:ABC transporter permease [Lachnospiraceae bacterium]
MRGLRYQLKSILHDKFCLMTFLLPIAVAAALNFAGSIDFSSLDEPLCFGVLKEDLSVQTIEWLERYGTVTTYTTSEELTEAINEPSTNLIGVRADGDGIQTLVSGDELDIFRQTADTLPILYAQRDIASQETIQVLERPDVMAGFQDLFIAVTLIVAMFMGCTFNAMNIISEKEDGVAFVNEILPMTHREYLIQKMIVGFICGSLSAFVTACICFPLSVQNAVLMLLLIVLSAFAAALIGLFIGKISSGLMVGVTYIKIVMLLFMAVPIVSFLVKVSNPFLAAMFYLVPSQAAFEGIMDLSAGRRTVPITDILIILVHCVILVSAYLLTSRWKKKNI